jgi:spoIIIJ-associated protein
MNESKEQEEELDPEWEESEDEDDGEEETNGDFASSETGESEGEPHAAEAGESAEDHPRRRRGRRRPADDRPPDERASQALEFVTTLIDEMEMDCDVRLRRPRQDAENEVCLEISGRDSGRIIGKKGQVLAAIQFLVNRVVNRPGLDRRYVTVDAEGYRSRRDNSLASMARRLGKQAVLEGKIITFEPMNPRDRRVVHLALAKFEGVITRSEGEGDQRRVQIIPVRR